jgi:hypothetical protein
LSGGAISGGAGVATVVNVGSISDGAGIAAGGVATVVNARPHRRQLHQ